MTRPARRLEEELGPKMAAARPPPRGREWDVLPRLKRSLPVLGSLGSHPSLGTGGSPVRRPVQAPGLRCSSLHRERTTNDLISQLLVVPAVEVQNK